MALPKSNMATQQHFPFMDLPRNIRNMIYKEGLCSFEHNLFDETTRILTDPEPQPDQVPNILQHDIEIALLRTCKTVLHEAEEVMARENRFICILAHRDTVLGDLIDHQVPLVTLSQPIIKKLKAYFLQIHFDTADQKQGEEAFRYLILGEHLSAFCKAIGHATFRTSPRKTTLRIQVCGKPWAVQLEQKLIDGAIQPLEDYIRCIEYFELRLPPGCHVPARFFQNTHTRAPWIRYDSWILDRKYQSRWAMVAMRQGNVIKASEVFFELAERFSRVNRDFSIRRWIRSELFAAYYGIALCHAKLLDLPAMIQAQRQFFTKKHRSIEDVFEAYERRSNRSHDGNVFLRLVYSVIKHTCQVQTTTDSFDLLNYELAVCLRTRINSRARGKFVPNQKRVKRSLKRLETVGALFPNYVYLQDERQIWEAWRDPADVETENESS